MSQQRRAPNGRELAQHHRAPADDLSGYHGTDDTDRVRDVKIHRGDNGTGQIIVTLGDLEVEEFAAHPPGVHRPAIPAWIGLHGKTPGATIACSTPATTSKETETGNCASTAQTAPTSDQLAPPAHANSPAS
jgi:hypothetical protein